MSSESSASMMPDKALTKEFSKRRVFAFFWVFFVVAIAQVFGEEGGDLGDITDNYIGIALAIIAIVVLIVWWKKNSIGDLKRVNNIMAILGAGLALTFLVAYANESSPADMAKGLLNDDIPTLFFGIFMLINRFV